MALTLALTSCNQLIERDKPKITSQISEEKDDNCMLIMENSLVELGISKDTGAVVLLRDKSRNLTYVDSKGSKPFQIVINEEFINEFMEFNFEVEDNAIDLTWIISSGLTLHGRVALDNAGQLSFTSNLMNETDKTVLAKEYPIIGHINQLDGDDAFAHPFATGVLFHNPLDAFATDGGGLRFMPYPEGFSGATMQFFTYYTQDIGGLYCAAYDGDYHQKWLNFYRHDDKLELSMMTGYEDIGAGKNVESDFPFVIEFTNGNGWYEAADRYKAWAMNQEWCTEGVQYLKADNDKATWLLEDVGLSTFGINAGYDRTKWLKQYSEDVGAPIFHVLGPDWSRVDQTFYKGIPGGYRDWFPTKFDQENLAFIKRNGDYFAPFEFDFLVDTKKSDGYNLAKNLQIFPPKTWSVDKYNFSMLCPYTEYTKNLHMSRDVQVFKEANVDSMYYDISANNLIKICLNPDHGHPVGGGNVLTQAYKDVYKGTQEALNEEADRYIPLGTEMICETYIDSLDYYQARAWAQPCSALETWPIASLIKSGQAEVIPMFEYVYHEYAPVRMDGWGKLVSEIGQLYYHTVAKVYLWGGLYEINHEYSPMEVLDGEENASEEHYYPFKPRGYAYDKERAEYLEQYANLRIGLGNEYLAYGIMQRPLELKNKNTTKYNWFHYNHDRDSKGVIELPSIVHSVFKSPEQNKVALFFANTIDEKNTIDTILDLSQYGIKGEIELAIYTNFKRDGHYEIISCDTYQSQDEIPLKIELDPYSVYMIEIKNK